MTFVIISLFQVQELALSQKFQFLYNYQLNYIFKFLIFFTSSIFLIFISRSRVEDISTCAMMRMKRGNNFNYLFFMSYIKSNQTAMAQLRPVFTYKHLVVLTSHITSHNLLFSTCKFSLTIYIVVPNFVPLTPTTPVSLIHSHTHRPEVEY